VCASMLLLLLLLMPMPTMPAVASAAPLHWLGPRRSCSTQWLKPASSTSPKAATGCTRLTGAAASAPAEAAAEAAPCYLPNDQAHRGSNKRTCSSGSSSKCES
jgi:hypothetical protein